MVDSGMKIETAVAQKEDFWVRSKWIWSAVFSFGFIIPLIMFWVVEDWQPEEFVRMVLLVAGVLIWHWVWVIWYQKWLVQKHGLTIRDRQLQMGLYIAGAVVIWYFLVRIHPLFFIALSGLYSQFYYLLHIGKAIIGSVLITAVWLFTSAQLEGNILSLQDPGLWFAFIGVFFGSLFGLWIDGIINQSASRRELLEQLTAVQAEQAVAEHRAGVLAERQRLAHEIHDTLAQGFVSIIMHLESAEPHLDHADTALLRHISQAKQAARENLKQVRRVVEELRPEPLEQATLLDAIAYVVQKWGNQTEIETAVTVTGDPIQLPTEADVTLLRATQEALSNIRKHARATAVQITLSYMEDVIILDVQDNGMGLANNNNPTMRPGGYGLIAMRERVAQFNGTVLLESEPGEGTTIVVSLPIDRKE
jgi:signal transduction histidine kinase